MVSEPSGMPQSIAWVSAAHLAIDVSPRPIRWPEPWEKRVDAFWHEEIEATSPQFFRGPVLSVQHIAFGVTVRVDAAFTDYAHFLYSRRDKSAHDGWAVRPLFAAALPMTTDGFLVVGRMGSGTERPGRIQCIGGTAIASDVRDRVFLAEDSADREMLEEIGVGRSDPMLSERGVVGATVDPSGGVAVVVAYALHQDWARFRQRVERFFGQEQAQGRALELQAVLALPWGRAGLAQLRAQGDLAPRYLQRLLMVPELGPGWAGLGGGMDG